MVTNQSGDRPISSRSVAAGIKASPSDFWRSRAGCRAFPRGVSVVTDRWLTDSRAVSHRPPVDFKDIARRPASDRRGSKIRSVPGRCRPGTELIERSPPSDLGQKSKPLGQRLLTDFGQGGDRLVIECSLGGEWKWAGAARILTPR